MCGRLLSVSFLNSILLSAPDILARCIPAYRRGVRFLA
jgi:hypothetical protein